MDDGVNASVSPITAYCAFMQWFWANLTPYDQRRTEEGPATSWQCIDKEAASKKYKTKEWDNIGCGQKKFSAGRLGIIIPNTTPTGKRREIGLSKWTYVMKCMPKKKQAHKSWSLNIS